MPFPKIWSPSREGPLEARNRLVFGAHPTGFGEPAAPHGEPGQCGPRAIFDAHAHAHAHPTGRVR